jgi:hypothetical protein
MSEDLKLGDIVRISDQYDDQYTDDHFDSRGNFKVVEIGPEYARATIQPLSPDATPIRNFPCGRLVKDPFLTAVHKRRKRQAQE